MEQVGRQRGCRPGPRTGRDPTRSRRKSGEARSPGVLTSSPVLLFIEAHPTEPGRLGAAAGLSSVAGSPSTPRRVRSRASDPGSERPEGSSPRKIPGEIVVQIGLSRICRVRSKNQVHVRKETHSYNRDSRRARGLASIPAEGRWMKVDRRTVAMIETGLWSARPGPAFANRGPLFAGALVRGRAGQVRRIVHRTSFIDHAGFLSASVLVWASAQDSAGRRVESPPRRAPD